MFEKEMAMNHTIFLLLCIGIQHSVLITCFRSSVTRKIQSRSYVKMDVLNTGMEKLSAINAELLAKREGAELVGIKTGGVDLMVNCPLKLINTKASAAAKLLERDGCLSVPNILSSTTADRLLDYINEENERAKAEVLENKVPFDFRFGGVNCRGLNGPFGQRQDMFLPLSQDIVREALVEAAGNLWPLLLETVTAEARLHELSCLVADPGSPRQCMHADTIVLPCPQYPEVHMAPLYTFFVALQDVSFEMGPTVFLPQTHTPEAHLLWNTGQKQKELFISSRKAVRSDLKKGDVAIFDSRILHCGSANSSDKRRVLFYFTLSKQQDWPLPGGLHGSNSMRSEDRWRWQIKDVMPTIS